MSDTTQTSYAESRTGKGDEWFERIKRLKTQAINLNAYAEAQKSFASLIADAYKTLPQDHCREIARDELIAYCLDREASAHKTRLKIKETIEDLEKKGVE